ncbi:hypothetical protein GEV43_14060 [Actinomadura sp. J1-007]|nr:hypothetical protein [Actinomadura sp. J1-007]
MSFLRGPPPAPWPPAFPRFAPAPPYPPLPGPAGGRPGGPESRRARGVRGWPGVENSRYLRCGASLRGSEHRDESEPVPRAEPRGCGGSPSHEILTVDGMPCPCLVPMA